MKFWPLPLLILSACPGGGPGAVVPAPDADALAPPPAPTSLDAGACVAACAALVLAGCAEGRAPTCVARLTTDEAARDRRDPAAGGRALTCDALRGADTPAAIRAHGVSCTLP